MSELDPGTGASAEGWRTDPFGRHESRFFDGIRWTPYVRDGDVHAVDEPVEGVDRHETGPDILTAPVLVVERLADGQDRARPCTVFGRDGRDLGTVRRTGGDDSLLEVVGRDGLLALALARTGSARKTVITVRDATGATMGRLLRQQLPGMTSFALESAAGNVGFVRALSWAGWDIRVEDERHRQVADISQRWSGLDRAAFPVADAYVARIEREMRDPQRALVYAAALTVDTLPTKEQRSLT
ncbi:phospholipid scramblase-related protein [Nocardioides sp.]|uniref:phospholipid scramblase-related protein n=1 Tax=Nocardioides sp. TaxID=35761 RepID=UPI001A1A8CA8|nr:phospholipid scramblase-related protein [Nocardioides sp.]MBJ7357878.1 hypothetical protein [Nocardioides sp.]